MGREEKEEQEGGSRDRDRKKIHIYEIMNFVSMSPLIKAFIYRVCTGMMKLAMRQAVLATVQQYISW